MAGIEMGKSDQVRQIGAKICRFANGTPCLCMERGTPLCSNVRQMAIDCWELAHTTEMPREVFNAHNKLQANLDGKPVKKVRPRR
jgi:hypothetical protein